MAEVLNAIYEADFLDCSYGFRPGRSAHQALRTIHDAIISERVNWILDADNREVLGCRFILPPGLLDSAEEGGLALYHFDP